MKEQIDKAIQRRRIVLTGTQLPPDWYAGFHEWRQAWEAERHPNALTNLAYCYSTGKGVAKDFAAGVALYREAIRLGNRDAARTLFDIGLGCEGYNGHDPYEKLSLEERLQKDALYRELNNVMAADGDAQAVKRQPFFEHLAALRTLKAMQSSAVDEYLADTRFDDIVFAEACRSARDLELNSKHTVRHTSTLANRGNVRDGNTVYSKAGRVLHDYQYRLKNTSSRPLPGFISFSGKELKNLNPGEIIEFSGHESDRNRGRMIVHVASALGLKTHSHSAEDFDLVSALDAPVEIEIPPRVSSYEKAEKREGGKAKYFVIGALILWALYTLMTRYI